MGKLNLTFPNLSACLCNLDIFFSNFIWVLSNFMENEKHEHDRLVTLLCLSLSTS